MRLKGAAAARLCAAFGPRPRVVCETNLLIIWVEFHFPLKPDSGTCEAFTWNWVGLLPFIQQVHPASLTKPKNGVEITKYVAFGISVYYVIL